MSLEIIAELHPQHGGSMPVMREMIRQAKVAGAHVAKFQLYDAEALLGPDWNYLELSRDDIALLKSWCDEEEIEFMASVFNHDRLDWCEEVGVQRYKIASRTVRDDMDLCRRVLDIGKPVIMSLGHWQHEQKPFEEPHVEYLYCKAKYPSYHADMVDFPDDFPAMGLAGYSDHTFGIDMCLLAVANGARILEKHYTLDKTRRLKTEGAHSCSMTQDELAELSRVGGGMYRARKAVRRAAGTPPLVAAG
jgi:N,N'-diacetyllegionaminate synthase